jgi:branched-chain amino acid transport system ATP-binding protein
MIPVLINKKKQLNPFSAAHHINDIREETMSVLKLIGMQNLTEVKGEALSHGDKKRLEIGIVLACKPKLLLLDEPTAGMSQEETVNTVKLIKNLAEELGITIIFTEHDMKVVFSISDVISVLQAGRIIAEGTPDEVKGNKKVIEAYVGKEAQ